MLDDVAIVDLREEECQEVDITDSGPYSVMPCAVSTVAALCFFLLLHNFWNTVVPPYLRVIRSKTYLGFVKPRIVPNAIHI
jgi:hypothetical protein